MNNDIDLQKKWFFVSFFKALSWSIKQKALLLRWVSPIRSAPFESPRA